MALQKAIADVLGDVAKGARALAKGADAVSKAKAKAKAALENPRGALAVEIAKEKAKLRERATAEFAKAKDEARLAGGGAVDEALSKAKAAARAKVKSVVGEDVMEIPASWEEMQKQAEGSLKTLDTMLKTPLPTSVKDAVDGNFMEAGKGVLTVLLGASPKGEMGVWSRRVIPLRTANLILRDFERSIVNAYIMSASSPARTVVDGLLFIPKWIISHMTEVVFVIWPLLVAAVQKFNDVMEIERRVRDIETELRLERGVMAHLYSLVPGRDETVDSNFTEPVTAQEIRQAMRESEDTTVRLEREKAALLTLLRDTDRFLDLAVTALSIALCYLVVERLLVTSRSLQVAIVTLKPVKELRDIAIAEAKKKSLPQYPEKRTVEQKRSRRN